MNEPFDSLEAKLSALQPQEPSPELRGRIADRLKAGAPVPMSLPRSSIWWSGAITGGLVAACIAATLWIRPVIVRRQEIMAPAAPLQLPVANVLDEALPSVWTYRRALARSPQELEALFDKHSVLSSPGFRSTPEQVFIDFDAKLLLQGEL